tara:strand:+ start:64 stop:264 length:201 start_codon:yes stop_codon:yes gene_type:complete
METTFEKLEPNDLFANEYGQIMVKGYGVWFNTGKIVYCDEGDIGRYYVKADAPVTKINLPDDSTGE